MATSTIQKTISDIQFIKNTGTIDFTLSGTNGENVVSAGHATSVSTPEGYTRIMYGAGATGDPAVVPVGINSNWIMNTKTTTSATIQAYTWALFVKY